MTIQKTGEETATNSRYHRSVLASSFDFSLAPVANVAGRLRRRAAVCAFAFLATAPQVAHAQDDLLSALQGRTGAGRLLRADPLPGAPDGSTAYKVYYQSTGLNGEPITVSGMGIVPVGPVPDDGRPVVAWAHPTTGVVPRCAPSLARKRFQMIAGMHLMLARGYVIAATDYPGLGTPETHPYLVGDSEGRAVLDSVRAAREVPGAEAGTRFAFWGHSQGGQAALFTGLLADSYAPDLQLVGVAAAARPQPNSRHCSRPISTRAEAAT